MNELFICGDIYHHHHHHLPPWIRSFDLFRHRRFAMFSWVVHYLFFVPGPLSFDPPISKAVRLCLRVFYFPWECYQSVRKTPILGGPVCLS